MPGEDKTAADIAIEDKNQNKDVMKVEVELNDDKPINGDIDGDIGAQEEVELDTDLGDDTPPELSEREQIVQNIQENRRKEREEDTEVLADLSQPGDEDGTDLTQDGDDFTEIVVHGEKALVKTSDVIDQGVRTMQKEASADQRLEAVVNREKTLSEREESLLARENKFKDDLLSDEEIDSQANKFSDAIVEDEKVAGEMFKEVLESNRELRAATAELLHDGQQTRQEREEAALSAQSKMVKHYHENFEDIAKDGNLNDIFNKEANRVRSENPGMSYQEIFEEAGDVVRDRYMPENKKQELPAQTLRQTKQNMVRRVKKAGGKVNLRKPVPQRKTNADRIADIRAGRGQPAL